MPRAPKRCARCDTIVAPGATYCVDHRPLCGWTAYPSARNTQHKRDELRAFRDAVLAREPQCRHCGAPATEADHITPVSRGGSNNPNTNGQGLCQPCHAAKTRAERRR